MTTRICLWSGPRNLSTALMYSFAQRNDTTVFDEPLYAHYLSNTLASEYHPGAQQVLDEMENDGEKVVRDLLLGDCSSPVLFFKLMTHHLVDLDWSFMKQTVNILLTRDPVDMLPSYAENIERPSLTDVGYAKHIELLEYLKKIEQMPIVLDAKELLLNPKLVLHELCEQIGISFDPNMLAWKAGPRAEDGSWARYWYANVHQSTGFATYEAKSVPFPESLKPLLVECRPYYDGLSALAIKAYLLPPESG